MIMTMYEPFYQNTPELHVESASSLFAEQNEHIHVSIYAAYSGLAHYLYIYYRDH